MGSPGNVNEALETVASEDDLTQLVHRELAPLYKRGLLLLHSPFWQDLCENKEPLSRTQTRKLSSRKIFRDV